MGCVQSQEIIPLGDISAPTMDRASVTPIAIDRVVSQVPRGKQLGTVKMGLLCIPHLSLTAGSGQGNITDATYLDSIHHEFLVVDYPIMNNPTELFASQASETTRIRLGGRITDVRVNVCFPMAGFGDLSNGTADASVRVEWQAYDALTKSIILKIATEGYGSIKSSVVNPVSSANDIAVAMATRRLIVSPEFERLAKANLRRPIGSLK